jgi:tetratricopeptide (TPR) repeat protein
MHPTLRAASVLALLLSISLFPVGFAAQTPDRQSEINEHFQQARKDLEEKNKDLAAHELLAILDLDANNVDARATLGVVRFSQGQMALARDDFKRVLQLQPSLWKAKALLGLCEKALGNPDIAQPLLNESFPHLEDRQLRVQVGMSLVELGYARGDLDEVQGILHQLRELDHNNADILYASYRVYSQLAEQFRDQLALVAPQSARTHQILAEHMVNLGDIKRALGEYRQALQLDPRLSGAHFELGELILLNSSSADAQDEAQKEFETALAINSGDSKSECELAAIYVLRRDMDTALRHYQHAAVLNPYDAEAQIGIAKVLVASDQAKKALEHLLAAIRLDPSNVKAHYRLSQLYRQLGRASDAEREMAEFRSLKDAQNRIRSSYTEPRSLDRGSPVLNPDVPQ